MLFGLVETHRGVLRYDIVHGHVVSLARYLVHQLEVIAHSHRRGLGAGQQAVVESLATSQTVAPTVKGYAWHHYHLQLARIHRVVARRLLDMERAKFQTGFVVWKDLQVHAVDTRQIEMLATMPFLQKRTC